MAAWLLNLAWGAPCAALDPLLSAAEDAVVQGAYPTARERLADAEEALGCSEPSGEQLGTFWLLEGAILVGEGDVDSAELSLVAARRVAPTLDAASYGSKVADAWTGATEAEQGHLVLVPTATTGGRIDGKAVEWPATVAAGLHLVQVVEGTVRFGRVVRVLPGALERVETGLDVAPVAPQPLQPERRDPPEMLALGIGALALGAGALGMWAVSDRQLKNAEDVRSASRAQERRMAFGAATLTLGVVGLVGITGELVF